eukprot:scaffold579_cov20-Tisochrysis_lutea.AAC.2
MHKGAGSTQLSMLLLNLKTPSPLRVLSPLYHTQRTLQCNVVASRVELYELDLQSSAARVAREMHSLEQSCSGALEKNREGKNKRAKKEVVSSRVRRFPRSTCMQVNTGKETCQSKDVSLFTQAAICVHVTVHSGQVSAQTSTLATASIMYMAASLTKTETWLLVELPSVWIPHESNLSNFPPRLPNAGGEVLVSLYV